MYAAGCSWMNKKPTGYIYMIFVPKPTSGDIFLLLLTPMLSSKEVNPFVLVLRRKIRNNLQPLCPEL